MADVADEPPNGRKDLGNAPSAGALSDFWQREPTLKRPQGPRERAPRRATYRLQLHAGFAFSDAAEIAGYLADLGVSHVYLSPSSKLPRGAPTATTPSSRQLSTKN